MDFSNEFIVKKETDDTETDYNIQIKVMNNDCLFQHNLKHLFVTLEKLPDEIFEFYEPPDVPTKETEFMSKGKLDVTEMYDNKSDIIIKCEIVECDSETVDQIDTEDSKKVFLVEDNNNDTPLTKREHQCHICLKVFNYKHWHAHMNEVHSKITIKCELCKKNYKSKKSLRKHSCSAKIKQKVMGSFKCSECNAVFNTKDCMQKHVKNVHSKPVKCEVCNSRLGSETYLAAHMRRVHYDDGEVHSCNVCGKIFKSPRYVKIHVKNTHSKKNRDKDKTGKDRLVHSIE